MKVIVTGGMGFIGANIVQALYRQGIDQIIVIDHLEHAGKFINVSRVPLYDYVDKHDFLEKLRSGYWGRIDALFHIGACSSTVEKNGRYMMENNYRYSVEVLCECQQQKIPLIYASSAAVYGLAKQCREVDDEAEQANPINIYGYSKWLFDQYVKRFLAENATKAIPVVGLRYFNVYGAREQHKGYMSSVIFHLYQQLKRGHTMQLFEGWDGYESGEQKRDFIHVDDAVSVNLFFLNGMMNGKGKPGIYNCGTGVARPFNDIPLALMRLQHEENDGNVPCSTIADLQARGYLRYIPFPEALKGKYQSFTEADLTHLRATGYDRPFVDLVTGIRLYWPWLKAHPSNAEYEEPLK